MNKHTKNILNSDSLAYIRSTISIKNRRESDEFVMCSTHASEGYRLLENQPFGKKISGRENWEGDGSILNTQYSNSLL